MRATSLLRATASSIGTQSSGLKPVPLALLPPIPLYRRLLRAHRKFLPKEMRLLGDEYVKSEFRAHRSTDNPGKTTTFSLITHSLSSQNQIQDVEVNVISSPHRRLPHRMANLRTADRR